MQLHLQNFKVKFVYQLRSSGQGQGHRILSY